MSVVLAAAGSKYEASGRNRAHIPVYTKLNKMGRQAGAVGDVTGHKGRASILSKYIDSSYHSSFIKS